MVKTRCLYDPADPSDGERILVTRFWPRGMSRSRLRLTAWMKELAPSPTLLWDWKRGVISWDEYGVRYRAEMTPRASLIKMLANRAKPDVITLLCFEREENPHCHRYLLKELLVAAQIERRDG